MVIEIQHTTLYTFEKDVFIEPHYLRFRPVVSPFVSLHEHRLTVSPPPAGYSDQLDKEDNPVRLCWFNGLHPYLKIEAYTVVETNDFNPFSFIFFPMQSEKLPFEYEEGFSFYLETDPLLGPELINYYKLLLKESNYGTLDFLSLLTQRLHSDFTVLYREKGDSFPPNDTFELKAGSCRDLAWMQIHMLRHCGLAARFVSGYLFIPMEKPEFELHAWTEVYIPGGGWIGMDPSQGIFTTQNYIKVASCRNFKDTMPVQGTFRGNASANMKTDLILRLLS